MFISNKYSCCISPEQLKSGLFCVFYDLFKANLFRKTSINFQAEQCEKSQSQVK